MTDQSDPNTEPERLPPDEDDALLIHFVKHRDVQCPRCGYNLRALSQPRCPECREPLQLQVGAVPAGIGLFVMSIIPGAFSGICAFILMIPMIMVPATGGGAPPPLEFVLLDAFGWLSGLVAVAIYVARHRFVRLPRSAQIFWAILIWGVHLIAFGVLVDAII
jgi:hypothetical protein